MSTASKLAVCGGQPTIQKPYNLQWPIITPEDEKAVLKTLKSGILYGEKAPQVASLEAEYAKFCDVKYCLTFNSCSAALQAAIFGIKTSPGDQIITSSFSFITAATSILLQNNIPVFADINPSTYTIDPESVVRRVTNQTKAIIVTHIHGLPADIIKLKEILPNIPIIEDAGHSPGASISNIRCGALGDVGCTSLNAVKNLPGGEGGLLTTNNETIYNRAAAFRSYGEYQNLNDVGSRNTSFIYSELGSKHRHQELPAALARSQLTRLEKYNDARKTNCENLRKKLNKLGFLCQRIPLNFEHVYNGFRVEFLPELFGYQFKPLIALKRIQAALSAEGVKNGRWITKPIPLQPVFKNRIGFGYGCPWKCSHSAPTNESEKDYSATNLLLERSFMVWDILPPIDEFRIDSIVFAFEKIVGNMEKVLFGNWYDDK
jgi:perosamine synthetase